MSPGGVGCNPSEPVPQVIAGQSLWVWTVSLRLRQQAVGTGLVWLTWIRVNAISKHGFSSWLPISLRREASETIHPNWRWDARHSWCSYARRRASTWKWGGHKGRAGEYWEQQLCGENCWHNSCDHHPQKKQTPEKWKSSQAVEQINGLLAVSPLFRKHSRQALKTSKNSQPQLPTAVPIRFPLDLCGCADFQDCSVCTLSCMHLSYTNSFWTFSARGILKRLVRFICSLKVASDTFFNVPVWSKLDFIPF